MVARKPDLNTPVLGALAKMGIISENRQRKQSGHVYRRLVEAADAAFKEMNI